MKHKSRVNKASINWIELSNDAQAYLSTVGEDEWRSTFVPLMAGTMEEAGKAWGSQLGIQFDVRNIQAEAWFQDYNLVFAKVVSQTTIDQIQDILADGLKEGWSIDEMSKRLQGSFEDMSRNRARTIARTETIRASNAGSHEQFRKWGAETKEWSAAGDARTRDSHRQAGGQVVPMDKPFRVGGYEMMYPGDSGRGAPGKEFINCRCAVLPAGDLGVLRQRNEPLVEQVKPNTSAFGKPRAGNPAVPDWLTKPLPPITQTGSTTTPAKPVPEKPKPKPEPEKPKPAAPAKPKPTGKETIEEYLTRLQTKYKDLVDELPNLRPDGADSMGRLRKEIEAMQRDLKVKMAARQAAIRSGDPAAIKRASGEVRLLVKNINNASTGMTGQILSGGLRDALGGLTARNPKIMALLSRGRARTNMIEFMGHDDPDYPIPQWLKTRSAEANEFYDQILTGPRHQGRVIVTRDIPKNGRAHASVQGIHGDEAMIHVSEVTPIETYIHEMAHTFEGDPLIMNRSREFLRYRAGSEAPTTIRGMEGEIGVNDEFQDQYVGKVYFHPRHPGDWNQLTGTELLAMGFQKLHQDPIGFAQSDPEYFSFIMGIAESDV